MADCNQLRALIEASRRSAYDIAVIQESPPTLLPSLKQSLFRKLLKIIELTIFHIEIGHKIRAHRNSDAIVVHGFSTEFLIFTYISSLFWTKKVYFLTHHNIQQAFQNLFIKAIFKLYHSLGYCFIVNETTSILKGLGYNEPEIGRHVPLLHPVARVSASNLLSDEANQLKIGLIGKIRRGKQFSKTLPLLLELQKKLNFLLVIGTDDLSAFADMSPDGVRLINTSTKSDYFSVLASCDVIVLNYEKSNYFNRCSGVAADAIGVGTCVVCPDFPLMSNQINYPARVGVSYSNELELELALKEAMVLASTSKSESFESHYEERSIEKIADAFVQEIQSRIECHQS